MPLLIKYFAHTNVPVEVEGLTPSAVREKSLVEIEKFTIFHGNRQLPLAEFFAVSGDASDGRIEFEGDLAGVHWIGAKMSEGEIRVAGPAGRHVGSEMSGGEIHVEGDCGDWLGAEMHGGLIHVRGRAGHLVGAAYRGSPRGMTRGAILVGGDAGDEVGRSMRRGLIAIGGSIGDFPAVNIIAGSVFAFGGCGIRPAAGMRRGTLALFGAQTPALLPTFKLAGRCQPHFLRVYLRSLRKRGFRVPEELFDADFLLYHGDLIESQRGEILVCAA
ncbi:MAG TPA: formylmethanofuran dehydrogenase subunit C [Pirellulales bacterium]|nr:formylmethanofuran dehydrogenase subunit C [Pirellulales bacterium]